MSANLERTVGLELVAQHAKQLVQRLTAMEKSGVLSNVAADAVRQWADRVHAALDNLPPEAVEEAETSNA